jgi:hypothetical protein
VIIRAFFFPLKSCDIKTLAFFFHQKKKKKKKAKAKVVEFTIKKHLYGKQFPNLFILK